MHGGLRTGKMRYALVLGVAGAPAAIAPKPAKKPEVRSGAMQGEAGQGKHGMSRAPRWKARLADVRDDGAPAGGNRVRVYNPTNEPTSPLLLTTRDVFMFIILKFLIIWSERPTETPILYQIGNRLPPPKSASVKNAF